MSQTHSLYSQFSILTLQLLSTSQAFATMARIRVLMLAKLVFFVFLLGTFWPELVSSFSINRATARRLSSSSARYEPSSDRTLACHPFYSTSSDSNQNTQGEGASFKTVPLPEPTKYMSALEQSHREKELELLAELRFDDEAIHKFRKLWRSERGDQMADKIDKAWTDFGHPDRWNKAEKSLLQMIRDDPSYCYPFVFLSKLYCLQGRFLESQTIGQAILEIKPYHFTVLETMMACSFALQNVEQAAYWAARRLPPPTKQQERLEWVNWAIEDAIGLLEEAKDANVPKGSDDYGIDKRDCGIDSFM